ncbi:MAG: YkgJ family cysteine cluster protein [Chitinophagaceae bacterium]|nr:YkgJ family cysteine cluster protein [Chitinophagaceae bacterium]
MDKLLNASVFAPNLPKWPYFYSIKTVNNYIEANLSVIQANAIKKSAENERFRTFLNHQPDSDLDAIVQQLNTKISAKVDCTLCGNCCKTLMIVVTNPEADQLSGALQISRTSFDEQYIEKGLNEMMLINKMPCCFLKETKCTVYENRFEGCREFPALHLPGFKKRLFTHFMHYDRCMIIYNTIEYLKNILYFEIESSQPC